MSIPQEDLDRLDETSAEGLFDEHVSEEEETEDESVEEEQGTVSGSTDKEPAEPVEEVGRIPYSRFEKVNEEKIRALARLEILEKQLENSSNNSSSQEITPDEDWIKLWGDSPEAKEAYLIDQKRKERERIEITEQILKDIDSKQTAKQTELQENLNYIEENIASLEETLGRKLSESEESAILDIQDEWTPKDDKGNYIVPLISADKAYEIYTLRQSSAKAEKTLARRKVVSITGSGSDGESLGSNSENYDANTWGSWRNKL